MLPWATVTEVGDAEMVKLACAAADTVSEMVVDALSEPDVPLMVTVEVPVVAVLLAVNETTLVEVVGFVLKFAVTPLGRPEAESVTLPENPPWSFTVMVLVPADPPCVIETLLGDAESVKLGVDVPDNSVISPLVWGLPHPVHRSKPVADECEPQLPLVMSWKYVL